MKKIDLSIKWAIVKTYSLMAIYILFALPTMDAQQATLPLVRHFPTHQLAEGILIADHLV